MGLGKFVKILVIALILVGGTAFVVSNWSWVFAKRVKGRILEVERVTDPTAILGSRLTPEQMHSYAILIEGDDGKLYTASSEDRQWQVAKKGYCVDALLYRYPPWNLDKANTFFNARLDGLSRCNGEEKPVDESPVDGKPASEKPSNEKPSPPVENGGSREAQ